MQHVYLFLRADLFPRERVRGAGVDGLVRKRPGGRRTALPPALSRMRRGWGLGHELGRGEIFMLRYAGFLFVKSGGIFILSRDFSHRNLRGDKTGFSGECCALLDFS